jgi:2-phosphosulfolactate phosphatase
MAARRVDVAFTALEADDGRVEGRVAVVIDVLRATTTMVTALWNGADRIVPVAEAEQALQEASALREAGRVGRGGSAEEGDGRSAFVLTCGERDGYQLEGFDLGNSPLACPRERVEGRTLVMTTTNGTYALARTRKAQKVYIASFLNISAVANQLKVCDSDILIVCSGWKGRFCMEDTLLAGNLLDRLQEQDASEADWTDSAKLAVAYYKSKQDAITESILESDHARRLRHLAREEEIRYCCGADQCPCTPMFENGAVRLADPVPRRNRQPDVPIARRHPI